jgi:hypothetical protein
VVRNVEEVTDGQQLRRTGLYDYHVENGAKMVPFAGYDMPLTYSGVGQGKSSSVSYFSGTYHFLVQLTAIITFALALDCLMSGIWYNTSMHGSMVQGDYG